MLWLTTNRHDSWQKKVELEILYFKDRKRNVR